MDWLLLCRSGAQPSLGDDAQGRGVHGDAAQSLKLHRLVVLNKAYIRRPFAAKGAFELLATVFNPEGSCATVPPA